MKKEIDILNYYDAISRGYKNLYHNEQIKKINIIKDYLIEKGLILDLGAGDGVLNNFFEKNINIISLDLSFNLLKINKNKYKIQAVIENLPFKDDIFDAIYSFTCIQDVVNKKKAIFEIKRVLSKKGILILSFLKISKEKSLIINLIKNNFNIIENFEEEKDYMFILKKKN